MKNTVNTELHRGGRSHPPMSPPSPIDNFANPCYNILFFFCYIFLFFFIFICSLSVLLYFSSVIASNTFSPPSPIDNFANPCYNILFSISIFFSLFSLCFTVGCACRTRGAGVGPLRKNGASPHRPTRGEQAKPIEKKKAEQGKNKKQGNKQIIFGATLKAYEL